MASELAAPPQFFEELEQPISPPNAGFTIAVRP
jgi:hypothetical protein